MHGPSQPYPRAHGPTYSPRLIPTQSSQAHLLTKAHCPLSSRNLVCHFLRLPGVRPQVGKSYSTPTPRASGLAGAGPVICFIVPVGSPHFPDDDSERLRPPGLLTWPIPSQWVVSQPLCARVWHEAPVALIHSADLCLVLSRIQSQLSCRYGC